MVTTSRPVWENHSPAHICPFDQACSYLEWAGKELKLDPGLLKILSHPRKVVTVSIPVKMDNGEVRVLA
ncbi:MAG: glutamate dehydrogenase, partial [Sphaerospermopsis kisseleviana]